MVRRRATGATVEVTAPPEKLGAVPTAQSETALKVALEQATQRETLMQHHVGELKKQLETASDRIQILQAELDTCQALAAKLAQSEETVRQLAYANTKLTQDLAALQAESQSKDQAQSQPAQAPAKTLPASRSFQAKPAATDPKPALSPQQAALVHRQRQMLAHPVFPDTKLPGQMADQDLGWFD